MASKGKYATGTDGTDFTHRQRILPNYSISAEAKHYLKLTFYLHLLLYFLMMLKLSEDVLDRMDIFILELQELEIPKPDLWEWLYGLSFVFNIFASRAIKINSAKLIYWYLLTTGLFSLGPIIVAQIQYFPDFWIFIQEQSLAKLRFVWRDIPLSIIFEAFAIIAIQVHLFQLFYAYRLYKLWKPYADPQHHNRQTSQQSSTSSNKIQHTTANDKQHDKQN